MKSLVTLGTFDGVHGGHRRLLRRLVRLARGRRLKSAVVLFSTPPRFFFQPQSVMPLLTLPGERRGILRELGIDRVEVLKFGKAVASLPHEKFFENFILRRWRAGGLLVGADFAFGKGRLGDIPWLKSACRGRGIRLWVEPLLQREGLKVSSTRIRAALAEGDVEEAGRLLGRPYFLTGRVVKGQGLGRRFGVPTANLKVEEGKLLPRGVYKVLVSGPGALGRSRVGVCNVGTRPTVGGAPRVHVEVHIPGFTGDLYGKTLRADFLKRLRAERKFPSLDALKAQIKKDIARALR